MSLAICSECVEPHDKIMERVIGCAADLARPQGAAVRAGPHTRGDSVTDRFDHMFAFDRM